MPSTLSITHKIIKDFPQFHFEPASHFKWSPATDTIRYDTSSDTLLGLLHELGHALLGHTRYQHDIELLAMERAAWDKARILALSYNLIWNEDDIQTDLDTYRDWLHKRSICPHCQASGVQIQSSIYQCLACHSRWHVNQAKTCMLQRHLIKTP